MSIPRSFRPLSIQLYLAALASMAFTTTQQLFANNAFLPGTDYHPVNARYLRFPLALGLLSFVFMRIRSGAHRRRDWMLFGLGISVCSDLLFYFLFVSPQQALPRDPWLVAGMAAQVLVSWVCAVAYERAYAVFELPSLRAFRVLEGVGTLGGLVFLFWLLNTFLNPATRHFASMVWYPLFAPWGFLCFYGLALWKRLAAQLEQDLHACPTLSASRDPASGGAFRSAGVGSEQLQWFAEARARSLKLRVGLALLGCVFGLLGFPTLLVILLLPFLGLA